MSLPPAPGEAPLHLDAPDLGPAERAALLAAFEAGDLSPSAPAVASFEAELSAALGVPACAAAANGTLALELALEILGVGPGDEVVVPALTYVATAGAVLRRGASPVLCDVDPRAWTLDPARFAESITPRVKAVIPVHLFGAPADMASILGIARARGVAVIEDAAESLGATLGVAPGSPLTGTLGDAGIFSFNVNKIVTCGGGGALVFRDPGHLARARRLLDHGREPGSGGIPVEAGTNGRLGALAAALGRAQLARLPELLAKKRALFAAYSAALAGAPGVELQEAPPGASRWLPVARLAPPADPDAVVAALRAEGIPARRSFGSLGRLRPFAAARRGPLPVADALCGRLVWLPGSARNDPAQVPRVAAALLRALRANPSRPPVV